MKNSKLKPLRLPQVLATLLGVLAVALWLLPAQVRAIEDPPGCSNPANGGQGNLSQGGINFAFPQAHVGDSVPVFPRPGIAPAVTGLSTGLLRDWLGLKPEFFHSHPSASIWVFAFMVLQIFFWLAIVRWLSGGLYPLPGKEKP